MYGLFTFTRTWPLRSRIWISLVPWILTRLFPVDLNVCTNCARLCKNKFYVVFITFANDRRFNKSMESHGAKCFWLWLLLSYPTNILLFLFFPFPLHTVSCFSGHTRSIHCITFHPSNAAELITASQDGTLKLFVSVLDFLSILAWLPKEMRENL